MRLKVWHSLALIAISILVVYWPSLNAGYNSVDDLKMVHEIEVSGPIDLKGLFLPQGDRYYYRPLIILTYLLDRDAWGMIPSFMHLENILLHLVSALLVFAITYSLAKVYSIEGVIVAFLAALLFALHPLATESVSWISGRTDLLAGFLILLSIWLIFLGTRESQPFAIISSGFALLLACLAKEVAVFILPGMIWMVAFIPRHEKLLQRRIYLKTLALLTPLASVCTYFIMRYLAVRHDSGLRSAISGVADESVYDIFDKARIALKVYGFYLKKVFMPWPLNFGIVEISSWYILSGIVLCFILFWCILRPGLLGSFFLMSFCVLSPAILIPLGRMAWAPIAERYLYIPLAIMAPAAITLVGQFSQYVSIEKKGYVKVAFTVLLLTFFFTTLHRAWIWQDNVRLYTDTAKKSPNFLPAKAELASALRNKGRDAEAHAILLEMQEKDNSSDYLVDDINFALLLSESGDSEEARRLLLKHLDPNHKKFYDLLQTLLRINDIRLASISIPDVRKEIQEESLSWLNEQYRLRPDGFTLYRIGKMQLMLGENDSALKSFQGSISQTSKDASYYKALEKYLKRLEEI